MGADDEGCSIALTMYFMQPTTCLFGPIVRQAPSPPEAHLWGLCAMDPSKLGTCLTASSFSRANAQCYDWGCCYLGYIW